ncbi:MAG: hypothetical protein Q8N88_04390 [Nanoarchaeota archaeon]|nr:hypothetical protein [Nanoarchaeota archaeon]
MKKCFVLFLICFCLSISIYAQDESFQGPEFVRYEKECWENQRHSVYDKKFGFAWGWGSWFSHFLTISKEETFNWVATSDSEGFITFKFDKKIPSRILKKILHLGVGFKLVLEERFTAVRACDDWILTLMQPNDVLDESRKIFREKAGLYLWIMDHQMIR